MPKKKTPKHPLRVTFTAPLRVVATQAPKGISLEEFQAWLDRGQDWKRRIRTKKGTK